MHHWTRVAAGIFHGFHGLWIAELNNALNGGLLPRGYYAYPEQHVGHFIADLITLHATAPNVPLPPDGGGLAVAEAPPRVRHRAELSPSNRGQATDAGDPPLWRAPVGRRVGNRLSGE